MMKRFLFFYWLLIQSVCVFAQTDTSQQVVAGRFNQKNQLQKPYVILISADGFRYDYAKKYQAEQLLTYAANGITAASMKPSFPSVTFPNHYAIVSGRYPSHSGLVANQFYDRKRNEMYAISQREKVVDPYWYGGTPLWVLAEKQGLLSASFYWVGSEAPIQGISPSYFYYFNSDKYVNLSIESRIAAVKNWLSLPEEKRPHLITFYFPEVDAAGHTYGPDSEETRQAVKLVDEQVAQLVKALEPLGLPINYIFVSDHGMTAVDAAHPIRTPISINKDQFVITASSGTVVNLYAKNTKYIKPTYEALKSSAKNYEVYLKRSVPASLHYGKKDDWYGRIGDIVLFPHWPQVFSDKEPGKGYHGFDPDKVKEMHATFYAWGPAFKSGMQIETFQNVEVYQVVTRILGLNLADKIDGTSRLAEQILKK